MDDQVLKSHDETARDILRANDRGGYTVPTAGLYPYQWNWDSVFAAMGFATFDRDRAWRELETLFDAQWPDGMVPHIVFRADEPSYFPGPSVWQANKGPLPSSGISQPPVAATVIRLLADLDPGRAERLFDPLDRWHRWFHAARDPDGIGVIAITHPWESGRDNLPDWDKPGDAIDVSGVGAYTRRDTSLVDNDQRPKKKDYDRYLALVQFGVDRGWDPARIAAETPFFVADPGITAILLRAERDLRAMAQTFGRDTAEIDARIARLEAGHERLWNAQAKAYVSRDTRTGELAPWATSASFLPLYAGVTARKAALLETLDGFAGAVRFTVPSFDPRSDLFDPLRYWRGPVWAMMNWMIADGLARCGEDTRAARIRSDTAKLIRQSGFAEYFGPVGAEPCGGGGFSWTAAIWLAWGLSDTKEGPC
ncbi:MAG: trehalase family glycosidase [Rhodobacter sp.]|nr:trehalase family glycosidase [Rhodobacter sp.]